MLTQTWTNRLTTSGGLARKAALTVALASCTVVALSTIWGWVFGKPVDVSTPARSVVNRAMLVGTFAQDCVVRLLTASQSQQRSLTSCWPANDQTRLPTTPATIVDTPGISAVTTNASLVSVKFNKGKSLAWPNKGLSHGLRPEE